MKILSLILLSSPIAALAQANSEPAAGKAATPPVVDSSLRDVPDLPGLPRILLIGDSISMGYTPEVRLLLRGKANVHHPAENCGATERGLARLSVWLAGQHWDVIHFNFGLHDMKYLDSKGNYVPPAAGTQVAQLPVYEKNLREIVAQLRPTGAKLIFATTTPVPPGSLGRVAGDQVPYNKVATRVMKELAVAVDNLGDLVEAQQKDHPPRAESERPPASQAAPLRPGDIQLPFNVHFTPAGYHELAVAVVNSIETQLPAASR